MRPMATGTKAAGRDRLRSSVQARITSMRIAVPAASIIHAVPSGMRARSASVKGWPPGLGKNSVKIIAVASLPALPRVTPCADS